MRTRNLLYPALVIAWCVALGLPTVRAQPSGGAAVPTALPANAAAQFETKLGELRDAIAVNLSARDKVVVANVTIHVEPDLITSHNAASANSPSGPVVYVALSLAYELGLLAEAKFAEKVFGIDGLAHRYARHFVESYAYKGRKLLSLEDFAFLDAAGSAKMSSPAVQQLIAAWWESGLAFVLAHELGHHAANALYVATDTDADKRKKETLADEWAAEAMIRMGYSPLYGVMLTTYLLDGQERLLPGSYSGDHPFMVDRALHLLTKYATQLHQLYRTPRYSSVPLETHLAFEAECLKELQGMQQQIASRSFASLDQQSKKGDLEASELLALDYMNGVGVTKDVLKATTYLERAAVDGDFWAQSTLGVVYANGTAGSPDYARARFWLGLATAAGDLAAENSLKIVEQKNILAPPAKQAWCQGGCVLDQVQANLAPCEARMRARCVDSCMNRYNHTRDECENRFCNNMSDDQSNFARCFSMPTANAWQACAATCDPSAPAPQKPALDAFGSALQQVTDAAPRKFTSIRGAADPREADETFTIYRASVALPGLDDCTILVDDDTNTSPSYDCDLYRGSSRTEANTHYQSLVDRVNAATAAMKAATGPCTESTRTSGKKYKEEAKVCETSLANGTSVGVRHVITTNTATNRTTFAVTLLISAPDR